MDHLKIWLEAFYQPCKVIILPKMFESALKTANISTQKNYLGVQQYNAINIIKQVLSPI